jgi:hypothetical protein
LDFSINLQGGIFLSKKENFEGEDPQAAADSVP